MSSIIKKDVSDKVLMIGEYFKHNAPGGMASVLASYDLYIEDMKFIANWKAGTFILKLWYAIKSIVVCCFTLLFDKKIRIVHIQGAAFASFDRSEVFVRMAHVFGKKIVYHIHCADFESYYNPLSLKRKKSVLALLNSCDVFVVLSKEWKNYFVGLGIKDSIIRILNNPVSPAVKVKTENNDGKIIFLYLGIIGWRKGVYDIIDVLNEHYDFFKGKIQFIIGGNQEEKKLKQYIIDKKVSDLVDFKGFISGEQKTYCLSYADVYVLPSQKEGLPIGILENMVYGHPIISTNVGGIPEVLHNGENGIMIEAGNKEELAEAMKLYVNNPELIKRHGAGSLRIVSDYLPAKVFNDLSLIYMDLEKQ